MHDTSSSARLQLKHGLEFMSTPVSPNRTTKREKKSKPHLCFFFLKKSLSAFCPPPHKGGEHVLKTYWTICSCGCYNHLQREYSREILLLRALFSYSTWKRPFLLFREFVTFSSDSFFSTTISRFHGLQFVGFLF